MTMLKIKTKKRISKAYLFFILVCLLFVPRLAKPCTIVSATASDGQVWNANNEDGPYGVANFINVFPKTVEANYGYYTLSYLSPELGQAGGIQGGMNEAGLTFDFNAIRHVENFDSQSKKAFPQGDDAILPYILANLSTTQEVVDFFKIYWFQNGFESAQMHVADKKGDFAIISASGIKLVNDEKFLISTNFDICGKEDGSTCWRYPIAESKLSEREINLMTMMSICLETAQKNGSTLYSNIQNLTTGDIWFFSKHDPNVIVNTNIKNVLSKGRKSYTFNDLKSLEEERPPYVWEKPTSIKLSDSSKNKHTGSYHNSFTGYILVKKHTNGLEISFADGTIDVFLPQTDRKFFISNEDVWVEFSFDELAKEMAIDLYENGYRLFRAWKRNNEEHSKN
jgi:hypothetical protein